ncbi:type III flagellar switch regulator (C-ring) FliN [Rhodovulum bhavnagarense]|uniref:Type III flagellar switch regulator (C-ring) FliN n=1 Tax=Rhodovulum bhavnagarense TaxID=992286 RepID=A0A4R2RPS1_9RHOB|nr:FliM/FliN family flagellar motor C-terminal domain-containing protein [Rhodovulum bhavnagarense]TCP61831.1 type III flagellar switch regulator (C-ring) FliN [Rhodovulum bhavnagarense]
MIDDTHRAILKRITAPPADTDPAGDAAALAQALRVAAMRAGQGGYGLMLSVEDATVDETDLAGLAGEMTENSLGVLLDAENGGGGLAVFSADLALMLVEWRLTGALAEVAPSPRPMTPTDAAILADFTDPLLTALAAETGADWARGFVQGAVLEDARHVVLRMARGDYRALRLSLSTVAGARCGTLVLALPGLRAGDGASPAQGAPICGAPATLDEGVLAAGLSLRAVLWRLRMPAAAVGRLGAGDRLVIPAAAIARLRLETPAGHLVARGRLGQSAGERAVRIERPDRAGSGLSPSTMQDDPSLPAAPYAPTPCAPTSRALPESGR